MLVWVLDPGLPGETNQCRGVASALAHAAPVRVAVVNLRLRSKMIAPLFMLAQRANLFARHRWLTTPIYRALFSGPALDGETPDLTISTLGRGEIPALLLRRHFGAYTLHVGIPCRISSIHFDLVTHLPSQDASGLRCPSVSLDIAPTPLLLADVRAHVSPLVDKWRARAHRIAVVLVGGDGSGYRYRPDEWEQFARGLARLSREQALDLLLTTSRRTGTTAETEIEAGTAGLPGLLHAAWFRDAAPGLMKDYLAAADIVICTEDSRSMISEAIAAGKCVYTARPEHVHSTDPRLSEMLQAQEARRRIKRISMVDICEIDVEGDIASYFRPRNLCWSEDLLAAIERSVPGLWKRLQELRQASSGAAEPV